MYAPLTRDDLDSSDLPASGDVTPVWADGERTKSAAAGPADAHTQHLASVTSHHIVASTMPTDAIAIHGQLNLLQDVKNKTINEKLKQKERTKTK